MFARIAIRGLIVLWLSACTLPEGPQPIAWDHEACTNCRMHIGEPNYAVQIQTRDGRILNFDDPGCSFEYRRKNKFDVHAIWYHHARENRWISEKNVAFSANQNTPMGFGWAAVDQGEPSALSLREILQ